MVGPSLGPGNEIVSHPLLPGAVQLPPDGRPIVILVDGPTIGGYPVLGVVPAADLPRLGQLRPRDEVRFTPLDGPSTSMTIGRPSGGSWTAPGRSGCDTISFPGPRDEPSRRRPIRSLDVETRQAAATSASRAPSGAASRSGPVTIPSGPRLSAGYGASRTGHTLPTASRSPGRRGAS